MVLISGIIGLICGIIGFICGLIGIIGGLIGLIIGLIGSLIGSIGSLISCGLISIFSLFSHNLNLNDEALGGMGLSNSNLSVIQ